LSMPDGWLCARMTEAALSVMASTNTSLKGCQDLACPGESNSFYGHKFRDIQVFLVRIDFLENRSSHLKHMLSPHTAAEENSQELSVRKGFRPLVRQFFPWSIKIGNVFDPFQREKDPCRG
jgi:hypothetical protein